MQFSYVMIGSVILLPMELTLWDDLEDGALGLTSPDIGQIANVIA